MSTMCLKRIYLQFAVILSLDEFSRKQPTRDSYCSFHSAFCSYTLIQTEIDLNRFVPGCLLAYPTAIPFNLFPIYSRFWLEVMRQLSTMNHSSLVKFIRVSYFKAFFTSTANFTNFHWGCLSSSFVVATHLSLLCFTLSSCQAHLFICIEFYCNNSNNSKCP